MACFDLFFIKLTSSKTVRAELYAIKIVCCSKLHLAEEGKNDLRLLIEQYGGDAGTCVQDLKEKLEKDCCVLLREPHSIWKRSYPPIPESLNRNNAGPIMKSSEASAPTECRAKKKESKEPEKQYNLHSIKNGLLKLKKASCNSGWNWTLEAMQDISVGKTSALLYVS